MSFYMSFYVFINHPIVKHLLSILNISATVGLDSGHTSGAAVCPPRALACSFTPNTTEDDGRWMKVVCNHCNLHKFKRSSKKPAKPWRRHLWGRMQVCCIYQGQACILANFRRKQAQRWKNMKDEEKGICSYLASHSQFCLSTQKNLDKLWFKQIKRVELENNSSETFKFQVSIQSRY